MPNARAQDNCRILGRIQKIHADIGGALGAPRILECLWAEGETASRNGIARLMNINAVQGWPHKKRRRMGRTNERLPGIPNLLERDLTALEPETKWMIDITELATLEGKLYLCVVLDLLSKIVMGWSMHHRQDRQMVISAAELAM